MPKINPIPKVNSKYGAPMGRSGGHFNLDYEGDRLQLFRIRLNAGGYDAGGAYWGLGKPLYCVMDGDGDHDFFRAKDRDDAKAKILADWPDAKFYR